jgi:hypothetical protein
MDGAYLADPAWVRPVRAEALDSFERAIAGRDWKKLLLDIDMQAN